VPRRARSQTRSPTRGLLHVDLRLATGNLLGRSTRTDAAGDLPATRAVDPGHGMPWSQWLTIPRVGLARLAGGIGCAAPETGAPPAPAAVDGPHLAAACPLYVKGHSQGEFVFDHAWADAAARAGIPYYPKLLVAVPFTPAVGARFLTHPDTDRAAAATCSAARCGTSARATGSRRCTSTSAPGRGRRPHRVGVRPAHELPVPVAQHGLDDVRRLPGRVPQQAADRDQARAPPPRRAGDRDRRRRR